MKIGGSIKGKGALQKKIKVLADNIEKNRNIAVQEATLALHREAVLVVSENKGGTAEIRYKPKRIVTVSEGFQPPHTDKGQLRKSIKFNFKAGIGQVGTNLKYGVWLEFGTETMAPRPWLSVAVLRSLKSVDGIFEKWFNKAIKETL